MKTFEITLFNQQVCDAIETGKRRRDLSDDWADMDLLRKSGEVFLN